MKYREEYEDSLAAREEYRDGIEALIARRMREAEANRAAYRRDIFTDPERYRADLRRMLGWPLVDCAVKGLPKMRCVTLSEEDGYTIYRMSFEILEGVMMTGLYFRLHGGEKRPLVLAQHGGLGTPEKIACVHGSSENYNEMLHRVLAQGIHVFAPQLYLWDPKYGAIIDRPSADGRLKWLGGSIAAVEIFGLMRILDYFEARENISSFGMVGLSYGGFYTLYMAALDTRIRSSISCAFYNTRDQWPRTEWTWLSSAHCFDDLEIACLTYPRKLCIEIGTEDALFPYEYGVREYEKLKEFSAPVGTDWLRFVLFDGPHEFCKDDAPIIEMAKDLFA